MFETAARIKFNYWNALTGIVDAEIAFSKKTDLTRI